MEANDLFNLRTLKSALFCALLMAAIDGEFEVEERNVCLAFLNEHWKKEYGSAKDFFLDTVKEVKPYIRSRAMTDQKLAELTNKLDLQQKHVIVLLVERVMMADKKVLVSETELFNRIKKMKDLGF